MSEPPDTARRADGQRVGAGGSYRTGTDQPDTGREEVLAALATSPRDAAPPEKPAAPTSPPPAPAPAPPPGTAPATAAGTEPRPATGVGRSVLWPGVSPAPAGGPRRRAVPGTRREAAVGKRRRAARPPKPGLSPAVGLPVLVLSGLVALFVAWVSAEPFWLAVGHHDRGVVEVTRCAGSGEIGTRCVGTFSAQPRGYSVDLATVSGAAVTHRKVGATLPARMVPQHGRIAYVGDPTGLHLRWLAGLGVLLALGLGMSAATGAWRFRGRDRAGTVSASLLAPLLFVPVALALTY